MATPVSLILGASEKICLVMDEDPDNDLSEALGEECKLTITYRLDEGEKLEEVVQEKAAEVGSLHALVQKAVRLARAERKATGGRSEDTIVRQQYPSPEPRPPGANGSNASVNGSERPLTGPQRLSIDDHFQRLRYTEEEVRSLLNARFNKSRIIDLSSRQASLLLSELQRMRVDPARANQPAPATTIPVNGRRSTKRNGY